MIKAKKMELNMSLKIAEARKSNLPQSPLKMKFLVSLIRNGWVPDALAQLKFSPKHRAVDVAKILRVRKKKKICNQLKNEAYTICSIITIYLIILLYLGYCAVYRFTLFITFFNH